MNNEKIFKGFFSYAVKDNETDSDLVSAFTDSLQSHVNNKIVDAVFSIFRDVSQLRTGDDFNEAIEQELRNTDVFIALLTPNWIKSDYCRKEFLVFEDNKLARGVEGYVVPILVRPIEPQAQHLNPEQTQIYAKLKRKQHFPADARRFAKLDHGERRDLIEKLADDIVKMIDRLRITPADSPSLEHASAGNSSLSHDRICGERKPAVHATHERPPVHDPAAGEAGHPAGPDSYRGTQKDGAHPQTRALTAALKAAQRQAAGSPALAGLDAFEFDLGAEPPSSPGHLRQKAFLYGALIDNPLGYGPIEYARANMTFHRTQTDDVFAAICNATSHFSSHTIIARAGQGKSITLAQIILQLASTEGYWTFWSFNKDRPFHFEQTAEQVEDYFDLFERWAGTPKRLVFVFDDFSARPQADAPAINRFHSWCESYAKQHQRNISFLFAVTDWNHSISPGETIWLQLDSEDENRLYQMMTEVEPVIAGKRFGSLDEMLARFPERRRYTDDVQSASDFIRTHCIPLDEFRTHWLKDLDHEQAPIKHALSVLAVPQLFDLALPERIAHELTLAVGLTDWANISRQRISKISRDDHHGAGGWPGYVLASPYRARSLLVQLDKFRKSFIRDTFDDIMAISLRRAARNYELWRVTDSNFIRHVFQRLSNKTYSLAATGKMEAVAAELFSSYGGTISPLLRNETDLVTVGQWAGTLSRLIPRQVDIQQFKDEENCVERAVYNLGMQALAQGEPISDSRALVSLMTAIRRMCNAFWKEAVVFELAERALEAGKDIGSVVAPLAAKASPDWERRVNECVQCYVDVLSIVDRRRGVDSRDAILQIYAQVESQLGAFGFRFDATNQMNRAKQVAIKGRGDIAAIRLKARLLLTAREAAYAQIRNRGEWTMKPINKLIKDFERHGRSLEERARESAAVAQTL